MERTYRCRVKNKMGKLFFCSCYLNSLFVKVILVDVFVLNINEQHQPTCVCIKIPINDWMTDLHNCMQWYCQHSQIRNSCEHIFFFCWIHFQTNPAHKIRWNSRNTIIENGSLMRRCFPEGWCFVCQLYTKSHNAIM